MVNICQEPFGILRPLNDRPVPESIFVEGILMQEKAISGELT